MKSVNKKTVLLVEDDRSLRGYIAEILSNNGFKVLEAGDGQEACTIYQDNENSIDVIASDLIMPNMDGCALAEFNYNNNFIPFVVFTIIDDAEKAIALLRHGVQDYLVKPIEEIVFIEIIKNAILRGTTSNNIENNIYPFAGNLGSITIPSKSAEIDQAIIWIAHRIRKIMPVNEIIKFTTFVKEMLLNAHTHGNLEIGEILKAELLSSGKYETEVKQREKSSKAEIQIHLSILKNEIAVNITDEGQGFDYDKYLKMTKAKIIERLEMLNGRGVFMTSKYFDSICYKKGGSSVLVRKNID